MKKPTWVFLYIKYGKFWRVSLEQKVEHKPPFSEEWSIFIINNSIKIQNKSHTSSESFLQVICYIWKNDNFLEGKWQKCWKCYYQSYLWAVDFWVDQRSCSDQLKYVTHIIEVLKNFSWNWSNTNIIGHKQQHNFLSWWRIRRIIWERKKEKYVIFNWQFHMTLQLHNNYD